MYKFFRHLKRFNRGLTLTGTKVDRLLHSVSSTCLIRTLHVCNRISSCPTPVSRKLHARLVSSLIHEALQLEYSDAEWNTDQFEERLFEILADSNGRVSVAKFKSVLAFSGLKDTDPRLKECMNNFENVLSRYDHENKSTDQYGGFTLDKKAFKECIQDNIILISKAMKNDFIIPEWQGFKQEIDKIYRNCRNNTNGTVASYIPQLARYSPDFWGVSICTVDGQRYSNGDTSIPFSIQSCSKPLTYCMVQSTGSDENIERIHKYVGHEPSGRSFNEISLDYQNKPHNPMINSGAIIVSSLLKPELSLPDRFDWISKMMSKMTGGEYLSFNNAVFLSERETADRNFALAYYMRENKCFPEGTKLHEVMDFYFQLCSIEVTCESASVIASTLANGGICPMTGERVFSSAAVRNTLSLMHSCGMYDYSGEFAFRVGLPAKSGVSGTVLLVVPNVMGICLWSPPLDKWGNSCRGIQFCQELVNVYNFHNYDNLKHTEKKMDPTRHRMDSISQDVVNILFGAFNGDVSALRRYYLLGLDMNTADYDGRTAIHVAAAEGQEAAVRFLLEKCGVMVNVKDRWGFTPLDEAIRFEHPNIAKLLSSYMERIDHPESD
ncbi:glutaminase kidney isoform, mitochondrial-like isoform X1 [Saccostrea echinata]|uniref:glutaminase kidney isoform, mitochondrial-like isoform X1 n=1 Tax=Saccostrea echinata TaxID=191078 RepID=UPI002A811CF2|nr:glutaminase kidney isoform, mitochondrial-like isoform X1 [Saccostrea echinata]